VVLGGGVVSYERGTPLGSATRLARPVIVSNRQHGAPAPPILRGSLAASLRNPSIPKPHPCCCKRERCTARPPHGGRGGGDSFGWARGCVGFVSVCGSGDTTPCRMTGVTLHSGHPTRGCIPRAGAVGCRGGSGHVALLAALYDVRDHAQRPSPRTPQPKP